MKYLARMAAVLVSGCCFLASGCDSGDSANAAPSGPDISGEWSGRYYITDGRVSIPLKASIIVNRSDFFIETTLPDVGKVLTGRYRNGAIFATDPYDGEAWTTHQGPATKNHVKLMDFLTPGSSIFQVIELSR